MPKIGKTKFKILQIIKPKFGKCKIPFRFVYKNGDVSLQTSKIEISQICNFEVVLAHCSLCLRADPVLRPQNIVFDNYFFLFSFLCKIDDLGVEITKS